MFSITVKLMKKKREDAHPRRHSHPYWHGVHRRHVPVLQLHGRLAAQAEDRPARRSELHRHDENKQTTARSPKTTPADRTTVADFNLDRIRATKGVNGRPRRHAVSVSISAAGKRSNGYAVGTSTDRKLLPVRIVSGDQPVDNNEVALPKSVANNLEWVSADKVDVAPISNGSARAGDQAHNSTEPCE